MQKALLPTATQKALICRLPHFQISRKPSWGK